MIILTSIKFMEPKVVFKAKLWNMQKEKRNLFQIKNIIVKSRTLAWACELFKIHSKVLTNISRNWINNTWVKLRWYNLTRMISWKLHTKWKLPNSLWKHKKETKTLIEQQLLIIINQNQLLQELSDQKREAMNVEETIMEWIEVHLKMKKKLWIERFLKIS